MAETLEYVHGESISVTMRGVQPEITFTEVFILAKDQRDTVVGHWTTDDPSLRLMSCGGIIHNSNVGKNQVRATWHAPSDLVGDIEIQAMITKDDGTIFSHCYSVLLFPRVNNDSTTVTAIPTTESSTSTTTTTTSRPGSSTQTPSPTADVGVNVTWSFNSDHITTIDMSVVNMKSAQWAAIGLSLDGSMGPAHVFICRRLANDTVDVNRYINPGDHSRPVPAGSDRGGIFTAKRQIFDNGLVVCQFTLSNFSETVISNPRDVQPLSQSTPYHPIFATGQLNASDGLRKHSEDSRTSLTRTVQLNRAEAILFHITPADDGGDTDKFLKAHGSLMVVTWILVVSTGILFARYFKNSWPNSKLCGKNIWFSTHRLLMSVAAILTLLGFMFVFTYTNGKWVTGDKVRAHAIIGIIVIGLAFLQPFIALFRCEPNSQYRFIFNYFHAFVGCVAFILSIVTLFLATTNFKSIFPTKTGWVIMIAWIVWMICIFILFEFVQRRTTSSKSILNSGDGDMSTSSLPSISNLDAEESSQQRLKNILLIVHICVATGLSIALMIPIITFD